MSVSQATGTSHSSRRRRRGGSARRVPGREHASTTPTAGTEVGVTSRGSGGTNGGGGGRGGGRRTLWEDTDNTTKTTTTGRLTLTQTPASNNDQNSSNLASSGTATGGGRRGFSNGSVGGTRGGGRGAVGETGAGGGRGACGGVHPAMLESEFLASTGQGDRGVEGAVASLSLEEVPYDRDLRWCNTASDSRPRPTMDTSGGVFGRLGAAIAQDTADYERLDRHYQELWKDREDAIPNGIITRGRGGGGAGSRAGRGRGRGRGAGGRFGGGRGGMAGREGSDGLSGRGDVSSGAGGGGGRGGGGQSRSPPFASSSKVGGSPVPKGRQGGASTAASAGGGGIGANARRRYQRVSNNKPSVGRVNGGVGVGGVRSVSGTPAGGASQTPPSAGLQQQLSAFPPLGGPLVPSATAAASVRRGRGFGSVPAASYLNSQRVWEGDGVGVGRLRAIERDPWAPPETTSGLSLSPPREGMTATTPPHVPGFPSVLGLPPDSPEYLGDLAVALNATPSPPQRPSVIGEARTTPPQPPPSASAAAYGSAAIFGCGSDIGTTLDLAGRGRGDANELGGFMGMVNETTLAFSAMKTMPERSCSSARAPAMDILVLADPSLDVDIQDICADADLNADAPAFVPGGYLPG